MVGNPLSLQYRMEAVGRTMKKRRIYTVFFLVGIFLFPLIFQPWHIVQHHGHDHECSAHAHHHNTDCSHESALSLISTQDQDQPHDPCYICDYKFPVEDLPTPGEPVFTPYQFQEIQSVNLVLSDLKCDHSLVNPRAPPCSSPERS